MVTLLDSYNESNQSNADNLQLNADNINRWDMGGQSFTTLNNGVIYDLDSCKFYMNKFGSPTGSIRAKLYSHSGTYGSSSVGDTLLATSDNYDISTLSTYPTFALVTFTFSGAERYTMSPNTQYVIVVSAESTGDASNFCQIGYDNSSGTHGGNYCNKATGAAWKVQNSSWDAPFYVYGEVTSSASVSPSSSISPSASFSPSASNSLSASPVSSVIERMDQQAMTNIGTSSTARSFSYTASGSDAIVFVRHKADNGISSITWAGSSMTRLIVQVDNNGNDHSIWGLRNASIGGVTITVTPNAAGISADTAFVVGAATYTNISKSESFPHSSASSTNPSTASLTVNVTTTVDNCVLVGIGGYAGISASNVSAGTGTTQYNLYVSGGDSTASEESNPLNTGIAGTRSLQVTAGNTANLCLAVIALAPAVESPSQSPSSSVSASTSRSVSPSASVSPSSSQSPSSSTSLSQSPSASVSPSSSSSRSASPSASVSPSEMWQYETKNSTSWTEETKNSTSWTNESANTTSWNNESKNSTTWNEENKNTTSWTYENK